MASGQDHMAARQDAGPQGLDTGSTREASQKARAARILYFITEDWFFCSHFLDRALAARDAGYKVTVVTRAQMHEDKIRSQGLELIPIDLLRRSANPWTELRLITRLAAIYKAVRPDVVHHIALKPILYGTLATRLTNVPRIVNAPVGMGYVFSSQQWKARVTRPLVTLLYRWLMNPPNSCVILENPDDLAMLTDRRIVDTQRIRLIRGAGVDLGRFSVTSEPTAGTAVVVLAARMLWDKGIAEFVEAARRLKQAGIDARFVLVGERDPGNPAAIPAATLEQWRQSGEVEWWGHRDDMPDVFAQAHIVCLPSYREGLPKVLIEAAACGRAIVATDVPGCREIVRDGENGYLVPARNAVALADALKKLILDIPLRRRMGQQGRKIAEDEFSVEKVNHETLSVYRLLLSDVSGLAITNSADAE